jgi:hypothetical protein
MTKKYLAECLWPGVTQSDVQALDARARATEVGAARYLGSTLVLEDDVVFCYFAAPSPECARAAAERAGIPFERVLETVRVEPAEGSRR